MGNDKKPIGFGDDGVSGSIKKFFTILLISLMSVFLLIYKLFKSNSGKSK